MLLTSISLIMFYILPNNLVIFWNKFGSFKRNTIILGHTLLDTSHNTGALHINLLTRIIPSVLYQNPPLKLFSGLWSCLKTISSTTDDKLRSVTSQKTRTRTDASCWLIFVFPKNVVRSPVSVCSLYSREVWVVSPVNHEYFDTRGSINPWQILWF